MIASEDVLFVMPRDRELQFPAMAALQTYVNNYQVKMQANCVTPTMPEYRFRYQVEMDTADWTFFQDIGIDLKQDREEIGFPDSVIELQDSRLLSFYGSTKHCSQVCAAIAGVEAPPYPVIRQVKPDLQLRNIFWTDNIDLCERVSWTQLLPNHIPLAPNWWAEDGLESLIGCVVGMQSFQTYTACAMGLPVIEILQKNRSEGWLSKWSNPLYRLVEEDNFDRIPAALASIKGVLAWRYSQEVQDKAAETQTVASKSIATSAESTFLTAR